ncbi:MAG: chemotaxis response regulator protein-glutamate methylesterase [Chloroflexi bacterium]|jgi:two-component system chemotaxis response regulator CheB|nr:chemotaxis response regulator protein-glutamate methylesterase [Chloroflexota bacterium]
METLQPAGQQYAGQEEEQPIRVLVVDDSAFMRLTISRRMEASPYLQVVGTAKDGEEALAMIPELQPDVVTLDVEMPRLNGLDTLRQIMKRFPRPVVMLSSLTVEGARETVQALTWGAVDFVTKPTNKANIEAVMDEVIAKIRRAARARVQPLPASLVEPAASANPAPRQRPARSPSPAKRVVVIGCSTGGPRALSQIIPRLPASLPAALLIVQHMPPGFTRSLAERLDAESQISVKEAAPGDSLKNGCALLAPGGYHMTLDSSLRVALNQNPPVHGVRPAVDVTLASVAQRFGSNTVGVILTGMGRDGANGSRLIRLAGGTVLAEDESTCVVWGMPRSVVETGAANREVPLGEMAQAIQQVLAGG